MATTRMMSTLMGAALLGTVAMSGCGGPANHHVALVGDSITSLATAALHSRLDPTYQVDVMGKFGARTDQTMNEVNVIASTMPAQAVINLGTNDVLQRDGADQSIAILEEIVKLFASADCIHLVTINEGLTQGGETRTPEAQALNERIRQLADRTDHVDIIDWNRIVVDHGGPAAVTTDSVHPNDAGQALLVDAYASALADC